jgi:hypothetical protein
MSSSMSEPTTTLKGKKNGSWEFVRYGLITSARCEECYGGRRDVVYFALSAATVAHCGLTKADAIRFARDVSGCGGGDAAEEVEKALSLDDDTSVAGNEEEGNVLLRF